MRIYELAKQLEVESKDVVTECKRRRITVKNHMSSLSDADVRRLVEIFEAKQKEQKKEAAKKEKEDKRKAKEAEMIDALERQQAELKKQALEESKMLEEARLRRLREQEKAAEEEQRIQAEIKSEQRGRALEIAEKAQQERERAIKAAAEEMEAEMALLAKARALRTEKEKQAREDAKVREAEEAKRGANKSLDTARRLDPNNKGKDLSNIKRGGRDKIRPSKVFRVGDVVRKSGTPTAPRSDGAPGGGGGPGGSGPGGGQGKDNRRGRGNNAGKERDRQRQQRRDLREHAIDPANPLDGRINRGGGRRRQNAKSEISVSEIEVHGNITTREFADLLGLSASDVIRDAFQTGEMLTINTTLSDDLLLLMCDHYDVNCTIIPDTDEDDVQDLIEVEVDEASLVSRPPVVTVMGHVDHGKTTLLDTLRKTSVADGEAGGITQHIGAYQVSTSRGKITFLDTPGHEAFTSMRARGTKVTDIVILVVAANDGVQPQTIEAINHAKAAEVPLIVAVNKIDLDGASVDKIQQEMLQHEVVSEELGGDYIFVPISAKHGTNIDQLLENVALNAEVLELKANPNRLAVGTVVESHVDPGRGAVATILVEQGTLKIGDYFVVGDQHGRVRAMEDDHGREVEAALPAFPVEIIGLSGSPEAGEQFVVHPSERDAREIAEKRSDRRRSKELTMRHTHVTLENLHERLQEGELKQLDLIIKADVQGSVEAIVGALSKIESTKVRLRFLHSAVGGVNESDVQLADVSDAIIIGFNIRAEASARAMAENRGVEIKTYNIIYDLIDDIKGAMTGLLEPTFEKELTGQAEVLQTFKAGKGLTVAGCIVRDGEIKRENSIRVFRNNAQIYEGEIDSLRRVKEDVSSVKKGVECGILIKGYSDLKQGDMLEAYKVKEIAPVL